MNLLPRINGLNNVRLLLALFVVVGHAWVIGGYRNFQPYLGIYGIGSFAVACFFAISGYLITKSRARTTMGPFLWHRTLRILPGLWIVLIVTSFVFAPIYTLLDRGTLRGVSVRDTLSYPFVNAILVTIQSGIGGTLSLGDSHWNGSIWTLKYELACYLAVAGLALVGVLRFRLFVLLLTLAATIMGVTGTLPGGNHNILSFNFGDAMQFFIPFGAGMTMALYEKSVPSNVLTAGCATAWIATGLTVSDGPIPIIAFPLAYLMLWLGKVLPRGPLGNNDISYGVYIYGYPIQQIVDVTPLGRSGPFLSLVISVPVVLVAAGFSWRLVEQPALRLKSLTVRRPGRARVQSFPTFPASSEARAKNA